MHTAPDRKDIVKNLRKGASEPDSNGNGAIASAPARMMIPLDKLKPNPDQARQTWDTTKDETGKDAIDRLAESIKNTGLLNDLVVTPQGEYYMIVCGERRYRAIKKHNLMKEVPCVVRENLTPVQILEISIVENLQRVDLTPIDEAQAYKALMEKCAYTQATLATKLGISGAMISYKLSLLNLTAPLQKMVATGKISETDGRSIAQTVSRIQGPAKEEQRAAALKTIEKEIEKEPVNIKTGKVETPAVKRVAEKAVTQVAGAKALPQIRAPRVAPAPVQAPAIKASAAIKEAAAYFITVLKDVGEILRPARKALAESKFRQQVIRVVLEQLPMLPSKIQTAISPLDVIHREATELINQKAKGGGKTARNAAKQPKSKKKSRK